ncbi:MAG: S-adenosylmethionine decarboxylase [Ktedonobacteraceae bacterium]
MQHVTLDLYRCTPALLNNETFLRNVLEEYPKHIKMVQVGPAELRYIKTSNPLDDGYSGFAIIATSHISLHAWSSYQMVNIDIFSCEEFSVEAVVALACKMFQTDDVEVHVLERATRSPRVPSHSQRSSNVPHIG